VNIRTVTLATLGVLGVARVSVAQEPGGELPGIAYGDTVTGVLAPAGDTLSNGTYYRQYLLTGKGGDAVTISLSSSDFNANLLLLDAIDADYVLAGDDNSGGDCNSHLTTTLPAAGRYTIIAHGSAPNEIGSFVLSVQEGAQPPASTQPCRGFSGPQGILQPGDTVRGAIGPEDRTLPRDGTHYQVWVLAPVPGRTVSIDLVSSDFDATLFLVRGMSEVIAANDDGGGGCNARLVYTAEEDRPYRFVTRAAPGGAVGSFELTVSEGAKPVMQDSTCQPSGP